MENFSQKHYYNSLGQASIAQLRMEGTREKSEHGNRNTMCNEALAPTNGPIWRGEERDGTQRSRVFAALTQDLGSIPSSHLAAPAPAIRYDAFFWHLWAQYIHVYIHVSQRERKRSGVGYREQAKASSGLALHMGDTSIAGMCALLDPGTVSFLIPNTGWVWWSALTINVQDLDSLRGSERGCGGLSFLHYLRPEDPPTVHADISCLGFRTEQRKGLEQQHAFNLVSSLWIKVRNHFRFWQPCHSAPWTVR